MEYVPGTLVGRVATIEDVVNEMTDKGTNWPPGDPIETADCASKLWPSSVTVGVGVFKPATVAFEMDRSLAAWDAWEDKTGANTATANDSKSVNEEVIRIFMEGVGNDR